jgi:hypothetical protein
MQTLRKLVRLSISADDQVGEAIAADVKQQFVLAQALIEGASKIETLRH